jgi:hypothetical protein
VRNTKHRHACMKNGDTQIARLRLCVSHYSVIRDTHPGVSLIMIHLRCVHYKSHLRRALRVCVTDLIADWGHYGTNTRRAKGRTSPITNKSETLVSLAGRRFDCQRYETETRNSNARLSIYEMGDVSTFVLNRDMPLLTHISLYLYNRRCAIGTRSPFYHRSGCVSNINLTEMHRKANHLLFTLHWTRYMPQWCECISFF